MYVPNKSPIELYNNYIFLGFVLFILSTEIRPFVKMNEYITLYSVYTSYSHNLLKFEEFVKEIGQIEDDNFLIPGILLKKGFITIPGNNIIEFL